MYLFGRLTVDPPSESQSSSLKRESGDSVRQQDDRILVVMRRSVHEATIVGDVVSKQREINRKSHVRPAGGSEISKCLDFVLMNHTVVAYQNNRLFVTPRENKGEQSEGRDRHDESRSHIL